MISCGVLCQQIWMLFVCTEGHWLRTFSWHVSTSKRREKKEKRIKMFLPCMTFINLFISWSYCIPFFHAWRKFGFENEENAFLTYHKTWFGNQTYFLLLVFFNRLWVSANSFWMTTLRWKALINNGADKIPLLKLQFYIFL